ncbi:MAG: metal-dependent hydrolase [Acidobacteria bacterium]|jgi:uncharacterized damage-inducible protein DinB|nr:metal-dependent hydrolase [Acidobacteriota bacterium]HJN42560.1 DinB family protein [Vicinamibacterales bacterium]|tara:strand:+ start:559 stop:1101 length:543 start_codon:yes stop_codon:yes gene_type:complete
MSQPEAWLLGRVEGCSDALLPVAHALVQAREELTALRDDTSAEECTVDPGGVASIGFHIAHIAGSLDRLFTYARDEPLSPAQLDYLRQEAEIGASVAKRDLFEASLERIDHCLVALSGIQDDQLFDSRQVGRDKLPSNVVGLLFHAAEHTTMHVGQIRTTLKIIRGSGSHDRSPGGDEIG